MFKLNKQFEIDKINQRQAYYVTQLVDLVKDRLERSVNVSREINFTSDTGTGKTRMMSMFIDKMISYYPNLVIMISSLSRGGLKTQVHTQLIAHCQATSSSRVRFYGDAEVKTYGTRKTIAEEVTTLTQIGGEREGKKLLLWIRDEGHRTTAALRRIFEEASKDFYKSLIINISATNEQSDVICNFADTMMLRTPIQEIGTWKDALDKLEEIKEKHVVVSNYNPCAVFRCTNARLCPEIEQECVRRGLRVANIIDDNFDSALCDDNNEVDVIINKYKIIEGIDIRRAHVLWLDNSPKSEATKVQFVGRARRNGLFWRKDIDICSKEYSSLLDTTNKCWVYYNVVGSELAQDDDGNLIYAPSNICSCEKFIPGTVLQLIDGALPNGLQIAELRNQTGTFVVKRDEKLGFNFVEPLEQNNYYTESQQEYVPIVKPLIKTRYADILKISPIIKWVRKEEIGTVSPSVEDILKAKKVSSPWWPDKSYFSLTLKKEKLKNSLLTVRTTTLKKIQQSLNDWVPQLKIVKIPKKNDYRVRCNNYLHINLHLQKIKGTAAQYELLGDVKMEDYEELATFRSRENAQRYIDSFKWQRLKLEDCTSLSLTLQVSLSRGIRGNLNVGNTSIAFYTFYKKHAYIETKVKLLEFLQVFSTNIYGTLAWENYISGLNSSSHVYQIDSEVMKNFKSELAQLSSQQHFSYTAIENDFELAVLSGDTYRINKDGFLSENRGVTYLVTHDTKARQFIEQRYSLILKHFSQLQVRKKSVDYGFSTDLNKVLGYCVEYYAKYLLYGEGYVREERDKIVQLNHLSEQEAASPTTAVLACLEKYKQDVAAVYGDYQFKIIRTPSLNKLLEEAGQRFVNEVIKQAQVAVSYLSQYKETLQQYSCLLKTDHIIGLADFISKECIFDLKCTGQLKSEHVKQVCFYHYLSTKRSDLDIRFGYLINTLTAQVLIVDFQRGTLELRDTLNPLIAAA